MHVGTPTANGPLVGPLAEPFHVTSFPDGKPWTEFYRVPVGFVLRFPRIADFVVSRDGHITGVQPFCDATDATVEHVRVNQVLPLALSQRDKLVVHASAVEIDDVAVAFAGETGQGKSTLAAAFASRGYRFLTDDGLRLEPRTGGNYDAYPSGASIRLWADSLASMQVDDCELAPALSYSSKARCIAGMRFAHCSAIRPLARAYILENAGVSRITFRRLTPAEALIGWAKHAFLLDVVDQKRIKRHFENLGDLANRLPTFALDYPRRYDDLPEVIGSIRNHSVDEEAFP